MSDEMPRINSTAAIGECVLDCQCAWLVTVICGCSAHTRTSNGRKRCSTYCHSLSYIALVLFVFVHAVAQHTPESAMEEEVAALLQAAGAATSKAVADSEDKLAMKVCVAACFFVCLCVSAYASEGV